MGNNGIILNMDRKVRWPSLKMATEKMRALLEQKTGQRVEISGLSKPGEQEKVEDREAEQAVKKMLEDLDQ